MTLETEPCRKRKIVRPETDPTYVEIEGEVYEVLGRHRLRNGGCAACLKHVTTGKRTDVLNYGLLALEIERGDAGLLNEMEVLAWMVR